MNNDLLVFLLLNISLILLAATVLTEISPLRRMLKNQIRSTKNQIFLGLIFGLLSISCTYTGLLYKGAVVNTRVVSTVAAGLVGGPLSGLIAGSMGGIHRYLYDPQGFTSAACSLGTFLFGVTGALSYKKFSKSKKSCFGLFLIVVASELIQAGVILIMCRPFEAAVELEKAILLPKILFNSAGLIAFMSILDKLNRTLTIELVKQQSVALFIAQKCLPYLREGMSDTASLKKAVDIIRENLPDFIVAITDLRKIAASSGISCEKDFLPLPSLRAIEEKKVVVIDEYEGEDGLAIPPDSAAVTAPLIWDDKVMGSLLFIVPTGPHIILDADVETVGSMASLFSSILELGSFHHQVALRQQAEIRALQSQINPHFLFNALNTISALCLMNPEKARETILVLANYFRQTLSINESFVTLEQELSNVNNYLYLTEARFEDAVHVSWSLPDSLEGVKLPPLILQPIVENAVRHGGRAVDDRRVHIKIERNNGRLTVSVSDEGKGFPTEILRRLDDPEDAGYSGLFNVRKRLGSIYKDKCRFTITSEAGKGSEVRFTIPEMPDPVKL